MKKATLTIALACLATLSFAHANVTSEAVKARMILMTDFKAPLSLISPATITVLLWKNRVSKSPLDWFSLVAVCVFDMCYPYLQIRQALCAG